MRYRPALTAFAVMIALLAPTIPAPAGAAVPQATAWGQNVHGELGGGFTGNTSPGGSNPLQVVNGHTYAEIAPGQSYTVARDTSGQVWHWGRYVTATGTRTIINREQVPTLTDVVDVAAGASFGMALKSDGTVRMWGENDYGQLGLGDLDRRLTPVPVSILPQIKKIYASTRHAFATGVNGVTYAWGNNFYGQLGDGTTDERHSPRAISLSQISTLSAGENHTLALSGGTNELFAWGRNNQGQLGDGTMTARPNPTKVLGNLHGLVAVAAGSEHSMALGATGFVVTWGSNAYLQLGMPGILRRLQPELAPHVGGVARIAASTYDSHIIRDGKVYSWGRRDFCMLGSCTQPFHRDTPFEVPGITGAREITAGPLTVFVLTTT
ncbi:RCC1 domain-containing protein [Nonomuraea sp. NPDC002799]